MKLARNPLESASGEESAFRRLVRYLGSSWTHYSETEVCPLLPGESVHIREGKVVRLTYDRLTPEEKNWIQRERCLSSTDIDQK